MLQNIFASDSIAAVPSAVDEIIKACEFMDVIV